VTQRLYAALDDVVVAAVRRLGRVGLLGWVSMEDVRAEIPECPEPRVLDLVVRRLVRSGVVELWRPDRPPVSFRQQIRVRDVVADREAA
jgi:hypothetical protein